MMTGRSLVLGPWSLVPCWSAMSANSFEKLQVYRLSEKLADEIWRAVLGWDHFSRATLGRQIVRAADSIGANIAEGTGQGTFPSNRRFVRTARGSLYETRHWLRRAHCRHLLSTDMINRIKPVVEQLAPKLNAYLRSIGSPLNATGRPGDEQRPTEATDNEQGTKDKGPRTKDR